MKRKPSREAAIGYLTDLVTDAGADDKDRLKAAEILLKNAEETPADNELRVTIEVAE